MRIAVLGGGISGLGAAHHLVRAGHDVVCFEPSDRPGGAMRSERSDGFLCEAGPEALLDGPAETRRLIDEVGLGDRVVRALPAARRRFIYVRGALRQVPTGPFGLLRSDILGPAEKSRLLAEPFIPRRSADGTEDESVLDFGRRRLGDAVATSLLAPAVIGIFAGDAARLSMRSALPRVHALEARHGSLVRGVLMARRDGVSPVGKPISFRDGVEELPRAIAARLGARLVKARARAIARVDGCWKVDIEGGAASSIDADAVIVATTPAASATLLEPLAPAAAAALRAIPVAPLAVVCLGFRKAALGIDLAAYGFLVARGERPTMLGCQYESSVFTGRAPEGGVLLRAILGGTFEPGIVARPEAEVAGKALADLRVATGLAAEPDFVRVIRHPAAIPQYEVGHAERVAAVDADLARHPGLHLLGYALRGVGVNDCIKAAADLARRL